MFLFSFSVIVSFIYILFTYLAYLFTGSMQKKLEAQFYKDYANREEHKVLMALIARSSVSPSYGLVNMKC